MHPLPRRSFLKTAAIATGAGIASTLAPRVWAQPAGSNDAVRIGVIGLNGKGAAHIRGLLDTPGARVAALCDVDPQILAREVGKLKEKHLDVFATTDARELLDRPDVDAVVIATPNFWHALLTVWACQAGKDVYVEKPVSHTIWEGRKMIEAAAKYGRLVQAGTQYRSDTGWPEAIAWIQAGNLGAIKAIHTVCYKLRDTIGQRSPWYPDWLDYNRYCGSTPMSPLRRERLHYDWHWEWRTGNGEIGNNGIHVLDIARRFLRHDGPPRRVLSLGGRFLHNDAAETPNTNLAVFDFEVPVVFEARGLPSAPGRRAPDRYHGISENGLAILCEGGFYAGYTGGAAYGPDGKQIRRFVGDGGAGHMTNFLTAVRHRRPADLAAPIATGHASTLLCHFANISYRLGRPAAQEEIRRTVESIDEARTTLVNLNRHLANHQVDLAAHPMILGPWVTPDASGDGIAAISEGGDEKLAYARSLLGEAQRPPYVIPDKF